MENGRPLIQLCELKASQWTMDELSANHRILSDVSPWLNAQGNHMHHQIINELVRRKENHETF